MPPTVTAATHDRPSERPQFDGKGYGVVAATFAHTKPRASTVRDTDAAHTRAATVHRASGTTRAQYHELHYGGSLRRCHSLRTPTPALPQIRLVYDTITAAPHPQHTPNPPQ